MPGSRAGQRLGIERLLAVWADDGTLVAGGGLRHVLSVASRRFVGPTQERDEPIERFVGSRRISRGQPIEEQAAHDRDEQRRTGRVAAVARPRVPNDREPVGDHRTGAAGSSVVFVGSIAAFRGRDRHAAYAATFSTGTVLYADGGYTAR
jgi:hypothetical protein